MFRGHLASRLNIVIYTSNMTQQIKKLLIASLNPGKITELTNLLYAPQVKIVSIKEFAGIDEVPETGSTFAENARLKASGYALQTGLLSLADDSGLEVAALGGRPGVLSARYGGPDTTFAEKITELLAEVAVTGDETRRARFVCSMAVADSKGEILFATEGVCEGRIAHEPRGVGGFGYDPIFIPNGFDLTFGELPEMVKRKISHRSKAFEQIIPLLRHFAAMGLDLECFQA